MTSQPNCYRGPTVVDVVKRLELAGVDQGLIDAYVHLEGARRWEKLQGVPAQAVRASEVLRDTFTGETIEPRLVTEKVLPSGARVIVGPRAPRRAKTGGTSPTHIAFDEATRTGRADPVRRQPRGRLEETFRTVTIDQSRHRFLVDGVDISYGVSADYPITVSREWDIPGEVLEAVQLTILAEEVHVIPAPVWQTPTGKVVDAR